MQIFHFPLVKLNVTKSNTYLLKGVWGLSVPSQSFRASHPIPFLLFSPFLGSARPSMLGDTSRKWPQLGQNKVFNTFLDLSDYRISQFNCLPWDRINCWYEKLMHNERRKIVAFKRRFLPPPF